MKRKWPTAVLGILTGLSLGLAGNAIATIPDADGVIHGCVNNENGKLRVIDPPATCMSNETVLDWNQAGLPGPTGPSLAVSGSKAGIDIPEELGTIAELEIPEAGSYVVFAKLFVFNVDGGDVVVCQLHAGLDVDHVEAGTGGDSADQVPVTAMALNVVHTFGDGEVVDLECANFGSAISARSIRITAIKVGSVIDGPLG